MCATLRKAWRVLFHMLKFAKMTNCGVQINAGLTTESIESFAIVHLNCELLHTKQRTDNDDTGNKYLSVSDLIKNLARWSAPCQGVGRESRGKVIQASKNRRSHPPIKTSVVKT